MLHIIYFVLYKRSHCVLYYPLLYFLFYFIIATQRYSSIQATQMIMEDLVDSVNDSESGDLNSNSSHSTSSSNFAKSQLSQKMKLLLINCLRNELGLDMGSVCDKLKTQLQQHL